MKKVKAILLNPILLGAQGFIAGAFLLWANPQLVDPAQAAPTPAPEVQIVPSVS